MDLRKNILHSGYWFGELAVLTTRVDSIWVALGYEIRDADGSASEDLRIFFLM